MDKKFKIIVPATLSKSEDGEWTVFGLASTNNKDLQGEVIDQTGLDLSPIDMKKGVLNWDHAKGPENTIGVIDSYKKDPKGLFLKGRLFKNHTKAKAVYEIMASLNKSDMGRMGMSVEGVIRERGGKDGKVIKSAIIHACALTMNPVNTDTYVNLVKSLSEGDVEFQSEEAKPVAEFQGAPSDYSDKPIFSANQVISILEKALSAGAAGMKAPAERSGGEALSTSDMAPKKKKKDEDPKQIQSPKPIKKMSKAMYKSHIMSILDNLQKLYPNYSRDDIWQAVKDRIRNQYSVIDFEN